MAAYSPHIKTDHERPIFADDFTKIAISPCSYNIIAVTLKCDMQVST